MQSMDVSNLEKMDMLDSSAMFNRNTTRFAPSHGVRLDLDEIKKHKS